ncbi:MAG: glycoside hydrolase family 88 protein [Prevotella sp.]
MICCCTLSAKESMKSVIDRGLNRACEQSLLMAMELEHKEGQLPQTFKDGKLKTSDYSWWCSGFFPGVLWYLYEATELPQLKEYAELYTNRLERVKNITYSHDLGFMLYCSYGNGWRLTHNPAYRDVMLEGARSLTTRYRTNIGLIRSWDFNRAKWQYPVIIDNMMNLEFLLWAASEGKEPRYRDMAISHADKTLEHHFRPDFSCYHVVSYDTLMALPHIKQTHQGYADSSAWARGQTWALYGYTMMYRETHLQRYLQQACKVAEYLMNHPRMPKDKIPYWDFDDPAIPNVPRDASSAAVMASALIDLSQLVGGKFGKKCLNYAQQQIRSLSSDNYLAQPGTNGNFILMHSTGNKPGNSEIDVPLSYADYYYVEALLRLKHLLNPTK